jgi:transcriptional regulator
MRRATTDTLIKALVGIEIPLTHITGKWKVSQNQPAVNQSSVAAGLQQQGNADALAMAALVREFGA